MANIYLGNTGLGGGGLVPVTTLPTANQENYNMHQLYLHNGEIKYLVSNLSGYEYKTLASTYVVNTFTFIISTPPISSTLQAETGMTWHDWVNSSYNTDGFIESGGYIYNSSQSAQVVKNAVAVLGTDVIQETTYTMQSTGGGNK